MRDIAKHDSKEKWKSDSCKNTRVYLLIAGDTVGIGYFLCNGCVTVGIEPGWWEFYRSLVQSWCGYNTVN